MRLLVWLFRAFIFFTLFAFALNNQQVAVVHWFFGVEWRTPMVIVVLASIGLRGLVPKALISTYLSFFPVAVGMVKGLRSPDPILRDLMRTYSASASQVFWKLRVPASVPFLFASMKVAIAISLVGAIVGELPTGAAAGIGSRLLFGSYYSQTIQMWSALVAGSIVAAVLVTIVGVGERIVLRRMGARA